MKNKYILGTIMAVAMQIPMVMPSFAVSICSPSMCSLSAPSSPSNIITNCKSYSDNCYGNSERIRTCNTCNSGYTRTKDTTTSKYCSGNITYYYCKSNGGSSGGGDDCDGTCDDCESTDWVSNGLGSESKTTALCNTTTCKCSKSVQYRCKSDYYGSGFIMIGSGVYCKSCPSFGHSMTGNNKKITDCYITSGSDSTGSYTFEENCYYTE